MNKIVLILLLLLIPRNVFANETVRFAIGDWPPYTSATTERDKILEYVVTESFKFEGIDVEYEYFPWKRSYSLVESGEFDGTFPWAMTEEHRNNFYMNKVFLISDEGVFFHLKSFPFDWNTFEDLKKYSVGVTMGYKEEKIYKDNGIKAQAVPTEDLNFKKILAGRIDIYQTSKIVGYSIINKIFTTEESSRFTHHHKPAVKNEFYILFSKKSSNGQKLADRFDAGLKKLKESGMYDIIMKSEYNPKPDIKP
jgi:polar amino acid transport system substrate-binding protein